MNRSSNVFNAAPLGSGGRSGFIFVKASQVCTSSVVVVLRAGRKLKAVLSPAGSWVAKLAAGRYLAASANAIASVTARLFGYIAVNLTGAVNAILSSTGVLSHVHRTWLTAVQSCEVVSLAALRAVRKVTLVGAVSASIYSHALLGKITQKFLASNTSGNAQVSGKAIRGVLLKGTVNSAAVIEGILNESSRSRASLERTSIVPFDQRRVMVK